MKRKNKPGLFSTYNYATGLFLALLFILPFYSNGRETNYPDHFVLSDSTPTVDLSTFTIAVPIFKIDGSTLKELKKDYKRIIIKVQFEDEKDLSKMKLVIYPSKGRARNGKDASSIEDTKITTQGISDLEMPLIVGNNYIKLKRILKGRNVNYILLKPIKSVDRPNQLVFNIIANTPTKGDEDLGNSNPSPPADPSGDR